VVSPGLWPRQPWPWPSSSLSGRRCGRGGFDLLEARRPVAKNASPTPTSGSLFCCSTFPIDRDGWRRVQYTQLLTGS
jgi:hypothetical protein